MVLGFSQLQGLNYSSHCNFDVASRLQCSGCSCFQNVQSRVWKLDEAMK